MHLPLGVFQILPAPWGFPVTTVCPDQAPLCLCSLLHSNSEPSLIHSLLVSPMSCDEALPRNVEIGEVTEFNFHTELRLGSWKAGQRSWY